MPKHGKKSDRQAGNGRLKPQPVVSVLSDGSLCETEIGLKLVPRCRAKYFGASEAKPGRVSVCNTAMAMLPWHGW